MWHMSITVFNPATGEQTTTPPAPVSSGYQQGLEAALDNLRLAAFPALLDTTPNAVEILNAIVTTGALVLSTAEFGYGLQFMREEVAIAQVAAQQPPTNEESGPKDRE